MRAELEDVDDSCTSEPSTSVTSGTEVMKGVRQRLYRWTQHKRRTWNVCSRRGVELKGVGQRCGPSTSVKSGTDTVAELKGVLYQWTQHKRRTWNGGRSEIKLKAWSRGWCLYQ